MVCTLINKCAKNLSKQTVLLQLIIKNVVTCFFLEHSVDRDFATATPSVRPSVTSQHYLEANAHRITWFFTAG